MSPIEICRLLLCGQVPAATVPELGDPDVRGEVQERLAGVGAGLRYAHTDRCWLAVLDAPLPDDAGLTPIQQLTEVDCAVVAAAWLHLVLLPAERRAAAAEEGVSLPTEPGERPSITDDDLYAQFQGRMRRAYFNIVIGKLKRLGFLRQRGGGGRLEAGPLLEVLGDEQAVVEARRLIAVHKRFLLLRRRAAAMTAELGLDRHSDGDVESEVAGEAPSAEEAGGEIGPPFKIQALVGRRIRDARLHLGLSQSVLAQRAGIDQGRISRIERGEEQPPRGVLKAIGEALGLRADELVGAEANGGAGIAVGGDDAAG